MAEVPGTKTPPSAQVLRMTTSVVAAYLRRNVLPSTQIADVIASVYRSLRTIEAAGGSSDGLRPAVPIRKSVQGDYLVCLEDGKKLKMLKRHLRSTYNLTPEQYRNKWGLPVDYPMVAPNYAVERSAFAKKIGLGRSVHKEASRAAPMKR
ncbi:MAG: MucR family transcriptional regulator [Stellaceae bacterium]